MRSRTGTFFRKTIEASKPQQFWLKVPSFESFRSNIPMRGVVIKVCLIASAACIVSCSALPAAADDRDIDLLAGRDELGTAQNVSRHDRKRGHRARRTANELPPGNLRICLVHA